MKYSNDYRLTVEQRRSLLERTLGETLDSHRFYVALYGTKVRWSDLTKPQTSWIVRLIDDEGRVLSDVTAVPPGVLILTGPVPPVAVGADVEAQQLAAIDAATMLPPSLKSRVGAIAWADLPAKYLAAIAVLDKLDPNVTIGVLDVRAPQAPVLAPG